MLTCKRCGSDDLMKSDLCGDAGCIHCAGTTVLRKSNDMRCVICKKECRVLSNYMCNECYNHWKTIDNDEREELLASSNGWLNE